MKVLLARRGEVGVVFSLSPLGVEMRVTVERTYPLSRPAVGEFRGVPGCCRATRGCGVTEECHLADGVAALGDEVSATC